MHGTWVCMGRLSAVTKDLRLMADSRDTVKLGCCMYIRVVHGCHSIVVPGFNIELGGSWLRRYLEHCTFQEVILPVFQFASWFSHIVYKFVL